ncbi:kinase-like domain-containing protein [Pilobolus umbonatus]|nr:kinase-like domain-containing protein [Pilobolus umbonatus]
MSDDEDSDSSIIDSPERLLESCTNVLKMSYESDAEEDDEPEMRNPFEPTSIYSLKRTPPRDLSDRYTRSVRSRIDTSASPQQLDLTYRSSSNSPVNIRSSPLSISRTQRSSTLIQSPSLQPRDEGYGSIGRCVTIENRVAGLNISSETLVNKEVYPMRGSIYPSPDHRRPEVIDQPRNTYYENTDRVTESPLQELKTVNINGDDYTILKQLGRGGSGSVVQAFSNKYACSFALKFVEFRRSEDAEVIKNEIALLRALDKEDSVVRLFDYQLDRTHICMVLELGEIDLAHLMEKQKLREWDINFIRYYWTQMLHSVAVIHRRNIVHSDLKPANFVLVRGYLKLIDFGIANKVSDDTTNIHRMNQIGTINYMSPESITDINEGRDEKSLMKLGKASDIWSLGCILYQMVYGKTPFYDLKMPKKLYSITNPRHEILFPAVITFNNKLIEIPYQLVTVLQACLDRSPGVRPVMEELQKKSF